MKVDVGLIELDVGVSFREDCAGDSDNSSADGASVMMNPPSLHIIFILI